jgi:hypothetical protein
LRCSRDKCGSTRRLAPETGTVFTADVLLPARRLRGLSAVRGLDVDFFI